MTGPLVLLGWADVTQILDQAIHAKPQSDALPLYVPASMMPRVRQVQAGLNESLEQMPWLEPVVLAQPAPAQPQGSYSADQAKELREALAQRLFGAWQTTPQCELDGEHTLRWGELSHEYQAAWVQVADVAISHPALPAPAQPQGAERVLDRGQKRLVPAISIQEAWEAAQAVPDWDDCLRISEVPAVDEALRNFSDDATENNAVCIVQEVIRAAKGDQ